MDEKGQLTLEGKVVDAVPVGSPILGFYPAEVKKTEIVKSQDNKLPVIDNRDYHSMYGADAYLLSRREVSHVDYESEHNRVWIKIWRAIQFYKITED